MLDESCHRLILSPSYYVEFYINDKFIINVCQKFLWFVFPEASNADCGGSWNFWYCSGRSQVEICKL